MLRWHGRDKCMSQDMRPVSGTSAWKEGYKNKKAWQEEKTY